MTAPAIGVCGFGRCGSSMVMRMLDVGGIPPASGTRSRSYELYSLDLLPQFPAELLAGRTVKLLDAVLHDQIPDRTDVTWKFIWLSRTRIEQATSQVKFLRDAGGVSLPAATAWRFAASYRRDEPRALRRLSRRGDLLVLHYEDAMRDPRGFAGRLADYTGRPDFDTDAAAAAVHRRSPNCAPDLTFELTGAAP